MRDCVRFSKSSGISCRLLTYVSICYKTVARNQIGSEGVAMILITEALPSVQTIRMSGNNNVDLSDRMVAKQMQIPNIRNYTIKQLDFSTFNLIISENCKFGVHGVRLLLKFHIFCLQVLNLRKFCTIYKKARALRVREPNCLARGSGLCSSR